MLTRNHLFRLTKDFLILILLLNLIACSSPEERAWEKATDQIEDGHFRIALTHLDQVIQRDGQPQWVMKALKEAARVSFFELKDYKRAAEYHRKIVVLSDDPLERTNSQRQLANIYFDHLADYSEAIVELNKLISLLNEPGERSKYKISLARAYYYQNAFEQSLNEVEEFLKLNQTEQERFDMLMLKGNIFLAKKDLTKAATVFQQILKEFPKRSKSENVGLTLAVCYEEMKNYKDAIQILKEMRDFHPIPEYLDLRIKRLEDRQRNLPGARGFRK
jgi:tetratricopeptide (TPR) repeat protein